MRGNLSNRQNQEKKDSRNQRVRGKVRSRERIEKKSEKKRWKRFEKDRCSLKKTGLETTLKKKRTEEKRKL